MSRCVYPVERVTHDDYVTDIGSALSRYDGVTEAQLREVHGYRTSDEFDDIEKRARRHR